MKPALILTHLDDRQTGVVSECLRGAGVPLREFDALHETPLPGLEEISGLVSLGGRASATQVDSDPALAAEVALMSAAVEGGLPVLGVCLGAQLLAVAAGGRVTAIGHMYVDWPLLSRLPSAAADPLFAGLPGELAVLEWHEDMIELPAATVELATTPAPGATLFRLGRRPAWGSQAHLEVTPGMLVDTWLAGPEDAAEIEAAGHDIDRFRSLSHAHLRAQVSVAESIFTRFGEIVREAQPVSRLREPESSASVRSGFRRP